MLPDMRDLIDQNKKIAREAINGVYANLGLSTDPDLRLYNRLTEDDFELMRQQYGDDSVLDYINEMEMRRAREGSNHGRRADRARGQGRQPDLHSDSAGPGAVK